MRKMTVFCDRCGKEIKGNPFKIYPELVTRETGEMIPLAPSDLATGMNAVTEMDFCQVCIGDLIAMITNPSVGIIHRGPAEVYDSGESESEAAFNDAFPDGEDYFDDEDPDPAELLQGVKESFTQRLEREKRERVQREAEEAAEEVPPQKRRNITGK